MKVEPIQDKETIRECMEYLKYKNERNLVMFSIGIYTGLRISDILQLRVKDVYCKNRISIKQKKTKTYIDIPINLQLKRILKEYCKDKAPYDYLIKSREGVNKPITRVQAYNILKEMSEYFGIERIGTHSMRKTAGFHMYKQSKDIGTIMKVLGHKEPSITLRYIGITEEDVNNTIRNLKYF